MIKFVTFLAVLFAISINGQSKLRVHVFYESLCPDSMNFVGNQLVPNIEAFNDYIEVVLVPFGKSRHIGNGVFTCQHGDAECRLNRVMSCALTQIDDQIAAVKYVGCQMKYFADRTGRQCVESNGLDWDTVSQCHDSDLGAQLQLAAEAEQNRIIGYPKFVPTIVYNEQFDQELQDQSLRNFPGVLCSQLGASAAPCA
uniref:CSON007080 protein n=1 Tax=Culicoides sonorensis TaxID=179676 RepID=A0A336MUT8_CULSO